MSGAPTPATHIWIGMAASVYEQLLKPGCSEQAALFSPTDPDSPHTTLGRCPDSDSDSTESDRANCCLQLASRFMENLRPNQVGVTRLPQQRWLPICTCKTVELQQRGHPCEDNKNQLLPPRDFSMRPAERALDSVTIALLVPGHGGTA